MRKIFSLVVKFISIFLMLAIIVCLDLELHQMDIKTIFLNRDLDKKIYVNQLKGYVVKGQGTKFLDSVDPYMI